MTREAPGPTTRIRELRKARGFTLKELALAIGTTPQTVQRLETANMTVSTEWLEKIAKALVLEPYQLLSPPDCKATPERAFLNALEDALVRNRRMIPALEDVPLALMEAVGSLSGLALESRKGLRPWSDVVNAAIAVAAGAMRIGIDGEGLRGSVAGRKMGEAA
jgi:transcriptional regulator with XRE-family HTH domain